MVSGAFKGYVLCGVMLLSGCETGQRAERDVKPSICEIVHDLEEERTLVLPPSLADYTHEDVGEITVVRPGKGIILLPMDKMQGRHCNDIETDEYGLSFGKVSLIARDLYDHKHADTIFIPGTTPDLADSYNTHRTVYPLVMSTREPGWFTMLYTLTCEARNWRLLGTPEEGETMTSLEAVNIEHQQQFRSLMNQWKEKGWVESTSAFEQHKDAAFSQLSGLVGSYAKELAAYYDADASGRQLYQAVRAAPSKAVVRASQDALTHGAKGVLLLCDRDNEQDIREAAIANSIPLTVVREQNVPRYQERTMDQRLLALRSHYLCFERRIKIGFPNMTVALYPDALYKSDVVRNVVLKDQPVGEIVDLPITEHPSK